MKFITALNTLFDTKDEIIRNCHMVRQLYTDCNSIDEQKNIILSELDIISELTKKCIQDNAPIVQNQDLYIDKYKGYVKRHEELNCKIDELEKERLLKQARADAFEDFMRTFESLDGKLIEFDEKLWILTIDKVKVMNDGVLIFIFQNGSQITA